MDAFFVSLAITTLHRLKVERMHFHMGRWYYSMGHIKVPVFCKLKNAILPLHETQVIKNGTVSLNGK